MAQPTQYNRQIDFTEQHADETDHNGLNEELDSISQTIAEVRAALAAIQRDDASLANKTVGVDQIDGQLRQLISGEGVWPPEIGADVGDVVGPNVSTDNALARFNGTTGKVVQNTTGNLIDDQGNLIFTSALNQGFQITPAGAVKGYGDFSSTTLATFDASGANVRFSSPVTMQAGASLTFDDAADFIRMGSGYVPTDDEDLTTRSWVLDQFGGGGGDGDFYGPISSKDNAIVRFDGTNGKVGQNSALNTIDDNGALRWESAAMTGQGFQISPNGVIGGWGNWAGNNLLTLDAENTEITAHAPLTLSDASPAASEDHVAAEIAASVKETAVLTGEVANGGTIPLPAGFTQAQCKWHVSGKHFTGAVSPTRASANASRFVTAVYFDGSADASASAYYIIIGVK